MADPIIVSIEVPPNDSPDNVTQFVAELTRLLGPNPAVRVELQSSGQKRFLHLRRVRVPSPTPG